ncbi:TIGR02679 domain-containing protein [Streptomyces sp. NPDC001981]|uniref:TIGR02679 domain-containing protein n=1 Tax=Streptomyces sp. NPDC001981 TaxID=3364628 RepID=UPI00368C7BEA
MRAQPALADWTASCRAAGLVGGSPELPRTLLADALTVLAECPAQAEPLPVFAGRVRKGDSHALDDGTRLSTLVLRALATLHDTAAPCGLARASSTTTCQPPFSTVDYAQSVKVRSPV